MYAQALPLILEIRKIRIIEMDLLVPMLLIKKGLVDIFKWPAQETQIAKLLSQNNMIASKNVLMINTKNALANVYKPKVQILYITWY